jgi:hypothetical protein
MTARLNLSNPRAALCQGGRPREDHPDRGRSCSDYPYLKLSGQQIGTHAHHLPLG